MDNMKIAILILCMSALMSCSAPATDEQAVPSLKIGEDYGPARERLISQGWQPVPAKCKSSNLCFGNDRPEMASDMATGNVCPTFKKDSSELTVCLEIISDGARVKSYRIAK